VRPLCAGRLALTGAGLAVEHPGQGNGAKATAGLPEKVTAGEGRVVDHGFGASMEHG
jgi:hypothetical protein